MKIVIIGAMEEEIALLKNKLLGCKTQQISHLEVLSGPKLR
jgi:nucleoside phosphorylase